ncbi:MAG: SDR family NAD(P)-dependent oxidoreductase [Caldilineaceae bacterium]|nr:SDR family NAD(P)-dependent oxidoreductase [Caldilineaceae bacterium]
MDLKNSVALVTGAGSGIGKGAAIRLAREGAKVGVLSRTDVQILDVVQEIKDGGGEAMPLIADVSQSDQLRSAVAELAEAYGGIQVVVANAGVNGLWAPIEQISEEDWDYTMDINLKGTFMTIKYALPWLRQSGGAIAVVASVNGTRIFSNTGATAYACSKGGQVIMTKMLAPELAHDHVRINVICPGSIRTEISDNTVISNQDIVWPVTFEKGQIPLTRDQPGTIEQCADLIHFLVSDASAHITGTELWIDGAQSLIKG